MLTTLIGIWISLTVISAGYIDYEVCNWVWGTQGASINCPIDSIGVGACGAGGNPDCSNGNFYTGLRCCQLVPYQTGEILNGIPFRVLPFINECNKCMLFIGLPIG